ncbi:hypothetical protein HDU97_005790 [Phlyctochytrium planicorne]|nr:hypothetical protein HDU97_005790 [Phlyctochytrium planicorne]
MRSLLACLIAGWCWSGVVALVDINGNGASFPADIYAKLTTQFARQQARFINSVTYTAASSGVGLQSQNSNSSFQWSGSDVAVDPKIYNKTTLLALPAVAGAIGIAYNIPELLSSNPPLVLRLSRNALPGIFMGTITQWNDPAILDGNTPEVQNVLSGLNNRTISLVVRSPGSGTSTNFVRFLGLLNSNVQPFSDWTKVLTPAARAGLVVAKTNIAVGNIVSSIPYTITYMDAQEIDVANGGSASAAPAPAFVQNQRGQYVQPTVAALRIALQNLNSDNVNINVKNSALSVLDSSADQAYPIAIVSNFVIRDNNISKNIDVAVWTLRFLWWCIAGNDTDISYNSTKFVSLRGTPAGDLTTSYLKAYKFQMTDGSGAVTGSVPVYGNTICDLAPEGTNPCKNGQCPNNLPFQSSAVKCVCDPGFRNFKKSDCSEPTPFLDVLNPIVLIQLILAALALGVIVIVWALLMSYQRDPQVKAVSPKCCHSIFVGCVCGVVAMVLYAASPSDIVCRIRIIFPPLGFGMVFGMLGLKTFRIYTIFGYTRRRSGSKTLHDNVLILITTAIGLVEFCICLGYIFSSFPVGTIILPNTDTFDPSSTSSSSGSNSNLNDNGANAATDSGFLVCKALEGYEGARIAFDVVLYTVNAFLLIVTLALAVKTRGAFKRFAESKAIALVTYVVTVTTSMALLVLYAIPNNTSQTNNVINMIRCLLFFVLSAGTPVLLFAGRLSKVFNKKKAIDWGEGSKGEHSVGKKSGKDHRSGEETTVMETATVVVCTYEVGVCRNRFGNAWFSAKIVVIPAQDYMMIIPVPMPTDKAHSFKISNSEISLPKADQAGSQHTASKHNVSGFLSTNMGGKSQNGLAESEEEGVSTGASSHSAKRQGIIKPHNDKTGWIVEFSHMEKLESFRRAVNKEEAEKSSWNFSPTTASKIMVEVNKAAGTQSTQISPPPHMSGQLPYGGGPQVAFYDPHTFSGGPRGQPDMHMDSPATYKPNF